MFFFNVTQEFALTLSPTQTAASKWPSCHPSIPLHCPEQSDLLWQALAWNVAFELPTLE